MVQILFFDSDYALQNFIHEIPFDNAKSFFFEKGLNSICPSELQAYSQAEVISCRAYTPPLDNSKLDLLPNLRLIATRSTGVDHIDLSYCRKRKISVVNVPSYGAATVAEFAFGLLLSVSRKIISAHNDFSQNRLEFQRYRGFDLMGKTLGIIGTGSIGQHMIRIAQGFGLVVKAYDLYPRKAFKDFYVPDLDTLLSTSDIISLHIPLTPISYHLLDRAAFQKAKKGVIIINTARGELIDTQALFDAIQRGTVAGAGLDVLENENFLLRDNLVTEKSLEDIGFLLNSAMNLKLLQFNNVIITPHIAFDTVESINRINQTTYNNIRSFFEGKISNCVIE